MPTHAETEDGYIRGKNGAVLATKTAYEKWKERTKALNEAIGARETTKRLEKSVASLEEKIEELSDRINQILGLVTSE